MDDGGEFVDSLMTFDEGTGDGSAVFFTFAEDMEGAAEGGDGREPEAHEYFGVNLSGNRAVRVPREGGCISEGLEEGGFP